MALVGVIWRGGGPFQSVVGCRCSGPWARVQRETKVTSGPDVIASVSASGSTSPSRLIAIGWPLRAVMECVSTSTTRPSRLRPLQTECRAPRASRGVPPIRRPWKPPPVIGVRGNKRVPKAPLGRVPARTEWPSRLISSCPGDLMVTLRAGQSACPSATSHTSLATTLTACTTTPRR